MSSTETIFGCLSRLSEASDGARLRGRAARPHRGPAFERLLRRGALVELAPAETWPVCARCDCGLDARPIWQGPDGLRAVCPADAASDARLEPGDLAIFRIDPDRLVAEIARESGLGEGTAALWPGLWRLGAMRTGREALLALRLAAVEAPGAILALRAAARGAPATLLCPELDPAAALAFAAAGIDVVSLRAALRANGAGPGAIDLAALDPAPQMPRLIFRRTVGEVRFDGRAVTLSHQLAPVFGRLVEKALSRDPVTSGPELEDLSGREAKDLVRELREALRAAGVPRGEVEALIVNVRGRGWRVGLGASEITLDP